MYPSIAMKHLPQVVWCCTDTRIALRQSTYSAATEHAERQRLADRVGHKIDGFCSELCWRNAGHAPC